MQCAFTGVGVHPLAVQEMQLSGFDLCNTSNQFRNLPDLPV
jgi:hypothetical protein